MEFSYTEARARLAHLLDRATEDREIVRIRRRGHEPVALVAAEELEGLLETAHLLRSPRSARRLLAALRRAAKGAGRARSVASLRRGVGLRKR